MTSIFLPHYQFILYSMFLNYDFIVIVTASILIAHHHHLDLSLK
jgi:hypothetical protein